MVARLFLLYGYSVQGADCKSVHMVYDSVSMLYQSFRLVYKYVRMEEDFSFIIWQGVLTSSLELWLL